jgi:hypothetical protein
LFVSGAAAARSMVMTGTKRRRGAGPSGGALWYLHRRSAQGGERSSAEAIVNGEVAPIEAIRRLSIDRGAQSLKRLFGRLRQGR